MTLALPNLHPALVHFPIALIPLATLLGAVALVAGARRVSLRLVALAWLAAALAATVAFFAGRAAADGLVGVPPQVQPLIAEHADQALRTLVLTWLLAALSAASARSSAGLARAGQLATLAGGLLAVALVGWTADRGGLLVYGHGLAVAAPPPADCPGPLPAAQATSPAERLTTDDGGTITWAPAPGDLSSGAAPVEVSGAIAEGDAGGAALVVDGRGLLTLPQVMGDVQVNAWLDLSRFEGEVSVLHHLDEAMAGGAFTVSTGGSARLVGSGGELLDEATLDPAGLRAVSVSAARGHYKGMIDGKVVTHGHGPELSPGRVGLRLDGKGQVLLRKLEAIPLGDH